MILGQLAGVLVSTPLAFYWSLGAVSFTRGLQKLQKTDKSVGDGRVFAGGSIRLRRLLQRWHWFMVGVSRFPLLSNGPETGPAVSSICQIAHNVHHNQKFTSSASFSARPSSLHIVRFPIKSPREMSSVIIILSNYSASSQHNRVIARLEWNSCQKASANSAAGVFKFRTISPNTLNWPTSHISCAQSTTPLKG